MCRFVQVFTDNTHATVRRKTAARYPHSNTDPSWPRAQLNIRFPFAPPPILCGFHFVFFLHRSNLLATIVRKLDQNSQCQDNSDSDEESTGEAGPAGRRFFNRKRRSTDASFSIAERGGAPTTEGRLRRMSNAIARRPRTSSLQSSTAEGEAVEGWGGGGGGDPIAAPLATRGGSRKSSSGDEIEIATRGAAGAGAGAGAGAAGRRSSEDSAKEKELLPPFTMALAVMLSGLRVFVVDQVCEAVCACSRVGRSWAPFCGMYCWLHYEFAAVRQ